jgi:hypothetical protein
LAQEFHNYVKVIGPQHDRLRLLSEVIGDGRPCNWDWVGVRINARAHHGDEAGESMLDFYSRRSPRGLDYYSGRFPDLRFECSLMDLSGDVVYEVIYQGGVLTHEEQGPIEWLDKPVSEQEGLALAATALGVTEAEAKRLWDGFQALRQAVIDHAVIESRSKDMPPPQPATAHPKPEEDAFLKELREEGGRD